MNSEGYELIIINAGKIEKKVSIVRNTLPTYVYHNKYAFFVLN